MDKKQKKLERALKLAGIDKEKFDDVIELLKDDDEEIEQTKEEQPKEEVKKEEPQQEVKKEVVKVEEQEKPKEQTKSPTDDKIDKLLAALEEQNKEIKTLKEKVEKSQSFGYNPAPKQPQEDFSPEDELKKAKSLR